MNTKDMLLARLQNGQSLSLKQILSLIVFLSIPAMLSNISFLVMQYIDASMVGHLSSDAAAAIGLVATSTWLLNGLVIALSIGFSVQVAHAIGAKDEIKARQITRLGLVVSFGLSAIFALVGAGCSDFLPAWLGGEASILNDAGKYFLIFCLSLPFVQLNNISSAILNAAGNMKTPSILLIFMCILDIAFNAVFIFPTSGYSLLGCTFTLYGAGMGVAGAALGTALAQLVVSLLMFVALVVKNPQLSFRHGEKLVVSRNILRKASIIAGPVALEQIVMCSAQIVSTKIVAPLGLAALAANSFSITIEGLCYMPGFGISAAATTLIGQSIGAKRVRLTRFFAWSSIAFGMVVMTVMGSLMYIFAPLLIGSLSPDPLVQQLGTNILQIEALCEPLYGAAIVATGVFRGSGDTMIPSGINLISMWLIRLPLAYIMAVTMGLKGVWIAMALELSCRGLLFIGRIYDKYSQKSVSA